MSKVIVIPCSGIGKVYGLMAREAVLRVTNVLEPERSETACLAHLVTGEPEAVAKVMGLPCITVDGCPALCAAKSVEAAGGVIKAQFRSVNEMKFHRGKNAGDGTALSDDGWVITDELAEKIAKKVVEILKEAK